MTRAAVVGIIANPFSGKDIRRLVAYGSVMDNLSKVRIIQRLLAGLREAGVRHVLYMPDPFALVPAAYQALRSEDREGLTIAPVLDQVEGESDETAQATLAMVAQGAGAIITLGGDGTNRLVAAHAGDRPLMPLSTGTNNTFPTWVEPTIAGLAAGRVALGLAPGACRREKRLRVTLGDRTEIALVDVALLHGDYTGSGAVWEPEALRELVVTQGVPHAIGLSAIAGQACPVERHEPVGAYLRFGPGQSLRAPIAPGRFATLQVAEAHRMAPGEVLNLASGPGVLASDGERLLTVPYGLRPTIVVEAEGPVVIDPVAALARA